MVIYIQPKDIQAEKITSGFPLTRVGISGIKKPVCVLRAEKVVTLTATIDVFVDLPSDQKGSHLSRNAEVVNEIIDLSVRQPVRGLEYLCSSIAQQLLDRHEYASYAEVCMEADYFLERTLPSRKQSLESYKLISKAKAAKQPAKYLKKAIGVEATGMTACPCAMETVKTMIGARGHLDRHLAIKDIPTLTHNQRNHTSVLIEVPEAYEIEADDLITIVERSFSSPTYEILKRMDEGMVVLNAHNNPKFVEDVVRDISHQLIDKYADLPDDVVIFIKSESEESIHKHNAIAELCATLGELRSMG